MNQSSGGRRSRRDRRRVLIAWFTVLVLVVGLGGAAVALAVGGGSDDEPQTVDTSPVLQLSRTSSVGLAGDSNTGYSGYQLDATLDQSTGEGVVISPAGSTIAEAKVDALLAALGMKDPVVTQVTGGWKATGTSDGQKASFALDERAGNLWQYARGDLADCLTISPGAQPDDSVSCAAAAPSTTTQAGPGKAALLKDAKDLFALVGVTPGTGLRANDDGSGATYLEVPLTVEGLPVVDVNLSVGVDDGGIVSALGLLDPSYTTVGKYPLISARTGFDQLGEQPVPAIARDCTGEAADCASPKPAKVTAARLAWMTSQNDGLTVLVPAWQFEVDGFYGPAVVAVSPQYLGGSDPGSPEPGSGAGQASSVPGSSGGADPGTPEPAIELTAPDAP